MFSACRPPVRTCDYGHVVGMGDDECEEGHQVRDQSPDQPRGFLGQLMDVISPASCLGGVTTAVPQWSQLSSCMGDRLSKLTTGDTKTRMTAMSEPVVIPASSEHTATIIFLHGLGDSGHGWAPTISTIKGPHVKLVCPSANKMAVTLNSGLQMPSWFDLKSLDPNGPEDVAGVKAAAEYVNTLIEAELEAGVASDRIILGGFSQGGALALYTALTSRHRLGGVVALSCWLPLHRHLATLNPDTVANRDTPFLQAHGDLDPTVPCLWGQMTATLLANVLKNHTFKTYKGLTHSSNDDELKDVKTFLEKTLK